jgi:hypothetical protein
MLTRNCGGRTWGTIKHGTPKNGTGVVKGMLRCAQHDKKKTKGCFVAALLSMTKHALQRQNQRGTLSSGRTHVNPQMRRANVGHHRSYVAALERR